MKHYIVLFFVLFSIHARAQFKNNGVLEDDLNVGGDIFTDFNEDLQDSQVLEDERFYRYGRFYSVNFSAGMTTFTGNRGTAYLREPPSFGLSLTYFMDFETAFVLGMAYSKHSMIIDGPVEDAVRDGGFGLIEINMFRVFFGFRYYIDTYDLGTAITWANPYLIGRMEYWYQTNKFVDDNTLADSSGGAFGVAGGFGLEFPVKIKESYIGVEALYHSVNFFDQYTTSYRPVDGSDAGYENLEGDVITFMVSYVLSF